METRHTYTDEETDQEVMLALEGAWLPKGEKKDIKDDDTMESLGADSLTPSEIEIGLELSFGIYELGDEVIAKFPTLTVADLKQIVREKLQQMGNVE